MRESIWYLVGAVVLAVVLQYRLARRFRQAVRIKDDDVRYETEESDD